MRKLLMIVVAVLGTASMQAQDLSFSGGLALAHEIIGENIKSASSVKVAADFDWFKESNFNFGPTVSLVAIDKLRAEGDEPDIASQTIIGVGFLSGFDAGRFTYKGGITYSVTDLFNDVNVAYVPTMNNVLEYQFKKDGVLGIRLGHDWFFNQNLFHYTHQTTLGLVFKFK